MLGPFKVVDTGSGRKNSGSGHDSDNNNNNNNNNNHDIKDQETVALIVAVRASTLSKEAARDVVSKLCQVLDSLSFEDTYQNTPVLGSSIGCASSRISGSLGPILKLVVKSRCIDVFLGVSCAHIVAPDSRESIFASTAANNETITVEGPSSLDHDSWVAELTQATQHESAGNPLLPDANEASQQLQRAIVFERDLGTLFHSSGMMSKQSYGRPQPGNGTYECRLDYGTFKIDAPRIGHFTNYTQDRVSVVQGKWAFKAGRTTGPTIGRQHGLGVCVRMWEKDRVQTKTTEFPILSSDGTSGPLGHFSRPCDSGSLIYDQEGRPLGLLWGGMDQRHQSGDPDGWRIELPHSAQGIDLDGMCFYTPIGAVIDSFLSDLNSMYGKGNFQLFWGNADKELSLGGSIQ
ncbi:hypothetical protein TruAng_003805 [Truncatella angustata]|nr:hypothetical protein TruAng_003805 [Truncatella angustata]